MGHTVELNSVFISLAVLMFIFFAIAVLIIIDHKAKIPGEEKRDLVSISGQRQNHPVWAWLVSAFLWAVIVSLAGASIYSMTSHKAEAPVEEQSLFTSLDKERLAEQVRHFHNAPKEDLLAKGKKPICYSCHGEFPHSKKPMVRTLLNMHTQFAGCITCHADSAKVPESELTLRWTNYSGVEVKGKPFGTDVDPATGVLNETDDLYSKIVPYRRQANGTETMLEITEDSEEAREFLAMRGQLTTQQQGAIKKLFHNIVNPVGRFCTRCHAPEQESYVPFRALGFSDKRISALTNLNIVGIVQKYKQFYLPTIFRGNMSEEEQKSLLGKDAPPPPATEEMKDDPRAWWRKTYGANKGN